MDQKRLILAAFLSLLVLLAWSYLFQSPVREPVTPRLDSSEPSAAPAVDGTAGVAESTSTEADATVEREAIGAGAEQRVEVDTKLGHAVFTNRGAQLLSYRVNEVTGHDGKPLEMVRARDRGPYPFAVDRSCRSAAAARRCAVCGRRSRAWTDRHQSGRSLRVQRSCGRRDQGVPLPRQRSDRGGHPCRRQRSLGRAVGPGPSQPGAG